MKTVLKNFLKVAVVAMALSGCASFAEPETVDSSAQAIVETGVNRTSPSSSLEQDPVPQQKVLVTPVAAEDDVNSHEIAEENTNQAHVDQVAVSINEYQAQAEPFQNSEEVEANSNLVYHKDYYQEPTRNRRVKDPF